MRARERERERECVRAYVMGDGRERECRDWRRDLHRTRRLPYWAIKVTFDDRREYSSVDTGKNKSL